MRRVTAVILSVALLIVAPIPGALAATATADYLFQNTFATSVGTAPDLTVVGVPDGGSFQTGSVAGVSRLVYGFPLGQGLAVSNASSLMQSGAYTIAVLFEFDQVESYRRLIDFKAGTSDSGLYVLSRNIMFFGASQSGPEQFLDPNEWVQVVVTRDAAGTVTAYAGGTQQFSFADTTNLGVVDPAANTLRFFLDDNSVGGEMSSGSVARIRIWDGAMTATEVANLDDNPPPFTPDPRCEADPGAECGTDGDDDIPGTPEADVIFGGDGNDTIDSGEGDDHVFGDAGDDEIEAGGGNDEADGGTGNDRVFMGAGNDLAKGSAGNDLLEMAEGLDRVNGGGGKDVIDGGAGFDQINGGKGFDKCFFSSRKEKRAMKSCEKKVKRAH